MKKKIAWVIGFIICLLSMSTLGMAASDASSIEQTLSEITLPVPEKEVHQTYLGVSDPNGFSIPEIKAEVVIIEIFSMYCPHCQKEAPNVNQMYERIEKDAELKQKVKIIGIGAGNSKFEVETFRDKYHIDFPLFPDEKLSMFDKLGVSGTPHFIGLRIDPGGELNVFYNRSGGAADAGQLMLRIFKDSGLNNLN